jgi:hypothetical protein
MYSKHKSFLPTDKILINNFKKHAKYFSKKLDAIHVCNQLFYRTLNAKFPPWFNLGVKPLFIRPGLLPRVRA